VSSNIAPQQPLSIHAKFLRRGAEKFLVKAMRLPDVAGALDFNEKIILRKRLDELAAAHVNTLILSEAQTENVLGVAGQAGLGAMVEIAIDAHELTAPKQARTTIARVGKAMKLLRDGNSDRLPDPRRDDFQNCTQRTAQLTRCDRA
jgi:hypothetical protein